MRTLTPILILAVSIGIFYLYIKPTYDEVGILRTQYSEYKNALDKTAELQARRDELLTKYNSFSKNDIDRLNRILPEKLNTVQLVTDIDSVAGRYGITVQSVQVNEVNVDNSQTVVTDATLLPNYRTTTVSFNFTATYPNLVNFLKDLEKSLQMIDFQKVDFNVPTEGGGNGIYEYNVSFNTYWLQ